MKVLFIGGTGVISSACTRLCKDRGIDLYILNRGETKREVPKDVNIINVDIHDKKEAKKALKGYSFDSVVNWIGFVPEHIESDIDIFRDITQQYIFISSASAYHTPVKNLPVTESTPLYNPYWKYSRDKIACENILMREYRDSGFPCVIVRPSHTYDKTLLPFHGGYTTIDRMKKGKKVIVHGDGSSMWTMTHHRDFAKGLVGLLGNHRAVGESFHITSDDYLSWDHITEMAGKCIGIEPEIVHVPSDLIYRYDREWGESLLGDKTWSMIFDNTKIKRFVPDFNPDIPFSQGIREIMEWYEGDAARQSVDKDLDSVMDQLVKGMENTL
ncbi:MAG: NAD-dependent epimerase/dehydratase family protein [Chitinivibrionales bacterium]